MDVVEDAKHIIIMANIILTTDCQRRCAYCFAQEDKNIKMSFTFDNFKTATNFIATGPNTINLLGGEPTLHKDFVAMLEYLIINNFRIQVFTNGMISDNVLQNITSLLNKVVLKEDQLYFAIKINEKKYRTETEDLLQHNFMKALGNLIYPSFTIHDKDLDLLFLTDIINKYNLDPTIREGLAMPVRPGSNKYLPIGYYSNVASKILELSKNSNGIVIKLDCGFPLCMFSEKEIEELKQNEENDFEFVCGQPIDIYPDLTFTNCYPLSKKYKDSISKFKTIIDLYKFLEDGFKAPCGIYMEQCSKCSSFNNGCSGGCKGFFIFEKEGI
jgi:MoaA/NifB/PqqE/SkfB family radical SAM enzyme